MANATQRDLLGIIGKLIKLNRLDFSEGLKRGILELRRLLAPIVLLSNEDPIDIREFWK